ncbi:MAG: hypothetical protein BAJALOKI1v1_2580001 [Promethearchaeota archaeon]|nr:MAG: hypothetical protein BAJALOKI1v1_2580001 [Candidatus Lokiarchaeota archaeon]
MPSYKSRDIDKECPICGGIISGGGVKVLLEGAQIKVCQSCAQHGKRIHSKPKSKHRPSSRKREKYSASSSQSSSSSSSQRKDRYIKPEVVLVDDYNDKIRAIRERNNLTQAEFAQTIQEKESLVRRIEQKKAKPTLKLAKKIQNTYNITLLTESDSLQVDTTKYMKKQGSESGVSLADFIKKKKD